MDDDESGDEGDDEVYVAMESVAAGLSGAVCRTAERGQRHTQAVRMMMEENPPSDLIDTRETTLFLSMGDVVLESDD